MHHIRDTQRRKLISFRLPCSKLVQTFTTTWSNPEITMRIWRWWAVLFLDFLRSRLRLAGIWYSVELRVQISALFFQMMEERSQLPVYQSHDHILQVIKESPVTLIRGETGCGKTTQVGLHQSTCTKEDQSFSVQTLCFECNDNVCIFSKINHPCWFLEVPD